jgi:prepilin-type N-terminal cleavage/methylation domain-containing protein
MSIRMLTLPRSRIGGKQNGFTLIEVFIAIFLLTVSLLGTAALTTGVIRANKASRNITTATALAESCLQENRRVGYSSAGTVPAGGSNSCVSGTTIINSDGVAFTRTLTIDPSVANIKTLTVAVSWSEGAVGTKSVSLVTILASVS